MAFKASPSSQHQHCTDEAQKAEEVLRLRRSVFLGPPNTELYQFVASFLLGFKPTVVNLFGGPATPWSLQLILL